MQLTVNGEIRECDDGISVLELLSQLDIPRERAAVEVNRIIVPRAEHAKLMLSAGDTIEIVHFVGGG